jgi:hypothetical protein
MSINFDLGQVKTDLADLPEKMLEYAFEVLMSRAELMKDLAQVYVRVDTGSLRDSIRIERGGESKNWRRVRVRAGGYVTNPKTGRLVDYAGIVEQRFPYMRPAFDEIKGDIADMIRAKVVEGCSK